MLESMFEELEVESSTAVMFNELPLEVVQGILRALPAGDRVRGLGAANSLTRKALYAPGGGAWGPAPLCINLRCFDAMSWAARGRLDACRFSGSYPAAELPDGEGKLLVYPLEAALPAYPDEAGDLSWWASIKHDKQRAAASQASALVLRNASPEGLQLLADITAPGCFDGVPSLHICLQDMNQWLNTTWLAFVDGFFEESLALALKGLLSTHLQHLRRLYFAAGCDYQENGETCIYPEAMDLSFLRQTCPRLTHLACLHNYIDVFKALLESGQGAAAADTEPLKLEVAGFLNTQQDMIGDDCPAEQALMGRDGRAMRILWLTISGNDGLFRLLKQLREHGTMPQLEVLFLSLDSYIINAEVVSEFSALSRARPSLREVHLGTDGGSVDSNFWLSSSDQPGVPPNIEQEIDTMDRESLKDLERLMWQLCGGSVRFGIHVCPHMVDTHDIMDHAWRPVAADILPLPGPLQQRGEDYIRGYIDDMHTLERAVDMQLPLSPEQKILLQRLRSFRAQGDDWLPPRKGGND